MSSRFIKVQIYNQTNTEVEYDNSIDTTWGIQSGTMSLDTQIMDTELRFGDIYSSKFEIQIFGLDLDLSGRKIIVTADYDYDDVVAIVDANGEYLVDSDGNILVSQNTEEVSAKAIFTGYIDTCTKDAIATDRNLVAYDIMYSIRDTNISAWFDNYAQQHTTSSLYDLLNALLTYMNITHKTVPYYSDYNITLELGDLVGKVATLTFGQLLSMCCEILLLCPHIDGEGVLDFRTLSDEHTRVITTNLEGLNSEWADYATDDITGVVFYSTGDDILVSVGTTVNQYHVASNILLLGLDATALSNLANLMLTKLATIKFIPCKLKLITSQMNYELGDMLVTKHGYCYIMKQSFYGSVLIEHEIECNGDKTLATDVKNFNQTLLEGYKISRIEQDIDKINIEVGESMLVNLPVFDATIWTQPTPTDAYFEITVPSEIFMTMSDAVFEESSYKFGIKLPDTLTSTELSLPKLLIVNNNSGSHFTMEMYIGETQLTNQLAEGEILYVEITGRQVGSIEGGVFVITDGYSKSQMELTNNQIVLKVDSNGNIVQVALGTNASQGSVFTVGANNILMTATEAIDLLAGGNINLSGKNISISSDNFTVDSNGNVVSKSFTVVPSATQHGSFKIKDAEDGILGSWGGNYVYEGVVYRQLTPTRKEADYFISHADFFAQNIYSNGSGDVTGGFTTHMKWDHIGLELQLLTDPFAVNEEDRTDLLQFKGDEKGAIDIYNYGLHGWGNGNISLRQSIQEMADLVKIKTFDINNSNMSGNSQALVNYVSLDSGYKFLCWLQPASSGWVTQFPIYITNPEIVAASAFWSGTLPSGSGYKIHFSYLEIRNL